MASVLYRIIIQASHPSVIHPIDYNTESECKACLHPDHDQAYFFRDANIDHPNISAYTHVLDAAIHQIQSGIQKNISKKIQNNRLHYLPFHIY